MGNNVRITRENKYLVHHDFILNKNVLLRKCNRHTARTTQPSGLCVVGMGEVPMSWSVGCLGYTSLPSPPLSLPNQDRGTLPSPLPNQDRGTFPSLSLSSSPARTGVPLPPLPQPGQTRTGTGVPPPSPFPQRTDKQSKNITSRNTSYIGGNYGWYWANKESKPTTKNLFKTRKSF